MKKSFNWLNLYDYEHCPLAWKDMLSRADAVIKALHSLASHGQWD